MRNRKPAAYYYRVAEGYSVKRVAYDMNVSPRTVSRWLKKYREQHPELPPILTPLQKEIRDCFESGLTQQEIALYLKRPLKSVHRITAKLGLIEKKPKTISYNPSMDNKVRQKF